MKSPLGHAMRASLLLPVARERLAKWWAFRFGLAQAVSKGGFRHALRERTTLRNRLCKPKSKRPALCRASRGTGRRELARIACPSGIPLARADSRPLKTAVDRLSRGADWRTNGEPVPASQHAKLVQKAAARAPVSAPPPGQEQDLEGDQGVEREVGTRPRSASRVRGLMASFDVDRYRAKEAEPATKSTGPIRVASSTAEMAYSDSPAASRASLPVTSRRASRDCWLQLRK